eukprot:TRINITY_DN15559_c0_g1_i1.p1 TRINITY_DN15559_c0_g1~~TRINITY_DN15559_c0_g1_i1.p1  ORF type:complete len:386 (-),score=59.00 TRINITY_DN15559_c0_g1_i1:766-1923(-)
MAYPYQRDDLSFWDAVDAAFPPGLMCSNLEYYVKVRVRKRVKEIGWQVRFLPGEPWESMIEMFAVAALDKIHAGHGDNPWFWAVAWPLIMGAAAADFFPDVGSPEARRALAFDGAAGHMESLLAVRSLSNIDAVGALPEAAVLGMRAAGQKAVAALPHVSIDRELPDRANAGHFSDGRYVNYYRGVDARRALRRLQDVADRPPLPPPSTPPPGYPSGLDDPWGQGPQWPPAFPQDRLRPPPPPPPARGVATDTASEVGSVSAAAGSTCSSQAPYKRPPVPFPQPAIQEERANGKKAPPPPPPSLRTCDRGNRDAATEGAAVPAAVSSPVAQEVTPVERVPAKAAPAALRKMAAELKSAKEAAAAMAVADVEALPPSPLLPKSVWA